MKLVFGFILILFMSPCFAKGTRSKASELKIEILVQTKRGATKTVSIRTQREKVFFNRQEIHVNFLPLSLQALRVLKQDERRSRRSCAAGTYTKVIREKGKTKRFKTCLESKSFSEQAQAMKLLQQMAFRSYKMASRSNPKRGKASQPSRRGK